MAPGRTQGPTLPLSMRIPPDVRAILERTAKALGMTLTDVVIDAIVEKAKKEGVK